jgi:N-acetylglutamate synthase-like GNAT family acetyltransferase
MNNPELTIIIRDAEPDDCQALARLLKELGYPQTHDRTRKRIKELSRRTKDRILVAQRKDDIVGCLSLHIMPLFHTEGNMCRVTALVVSAAERGKYIGRRLMEMAEAYARANECTIVEVTSGEQRDNAHSFYDKLGYKEKPKRFIKYLVDRPGH